MQRVLHSLLIALALCCAPPALADATTRLGFVFNLARFAIWPEEHAPADAEPYVLCFVGDADMIAVMSRLDSGQIHGHAVQTRAIDPANGFSECHVLYLAGGDSAVQQILRDGVPPGVLTIGEGERFLDAGGMIALVYVDLKYQFAIHYGQVRRSGLRLSSNVLKLAASVR